MPETKTPQKFPPEKGLRPSLHPTDDVLKVLDKFAQLPPCGCKNWEEYVSKYMEIVGADTFSAFDTLATLAFEAGQKSGEEKLSRLEKEATNDIWEHKKLIGKCHIELVKRGTKIADLEKRLLAGKQRGDSLVEKIKSLEAELKKVK